MATATKKCVNCKGRNRNEEMKQTPNKQWFCDAKCIAEYANKKWQKTKQAKQKKKDNQRKKELRTRAKWYALYQIEVNRAVLIRDKDKACFTCGTENPNIKYDAGHRYHAGRGGGDRRRFVMENIHKQCSVNCNQHGSGMPVEYDAALDKEYGEGFADYLKCVENYPSLKEQFPTWQDIEEAISELRRANKIN